MKNGKDMIKIALSGARLRKKPLREGVEPNLEMKRSEMSDELSNVTRVLIITVGNYLAARI
jgi:ATP sulfurylase